MDTVMVILFVLFMVWIIRGYHANKYDERYGQKERDDKTRGDDGAD
jgi:hypothetical protein